MNTHLINWSDNVNDYDTLENIPIKITDNTTTIVCEVKSFQDNRQLIQITDKSVMTLAAYANIEDITKISFLNSVAGNIKVNNIEMEPFQTVGNKIDTIYSYGWYSQNMVIYKVSNGWRLCFTSTSTPSNTKSYTAEVEAKTASIKSEYKNYMFNIHEVIDDTTASTSTAYSSVKLNNVLDSCLSNKVDCKSGWGLSECNFTAGMASMIGSIQSGTLGIDDSNSTTSTTYSSNKINTLINDIIASKGQDGGIVPINNEGKIDAAFLPSYVDDVIEGTMSQDLTTFTVAENDSGDPEPIVYNSTNASKGKIYVDTVTDKTYRWSGSKFSVISETLALGNTASTAYAGSLGTALCNTVTCLDNLSKQTHDYVTNAISGYGSTIFSDLKHGDSKYGDKLSCFSSCCKPYPLQCQIDHIISAKADAGCYLTGYQCDECNDTNIGKYKKITPTYCKFDTSIIADSSNAPMNCAVYNCISSVSTSLSNNLKTCIEGLDVTAVNPGDSGYISCVSETDGKINAKCQSFIGNIATSATSTVAPQTKAVVAFVNSCIESLDVECVGGDNQYIKAICEVEGKISATADNVVQTLFSTTTPSQYTTSNSNSPISAKAVSEWINSIDCSVPTNNSGNGYYVHSLSQADGKISYTAQGWSNCVDQSHTYPATAQAVKTYVDNLAASCLSTANENITAAICSCYASKDCYGTVKVGDNISVNDNGVISACPITICYSNISNNTTNHDTAICLDNSITLHCIAKTGLSVSVNSNKKTGNGISSISLDTNKNGITVSCVCFACANDKGCANAAKKLVNASNADYGAGNATCPVYFSGGVPVVGSYSLGSTVPANACIPTEIGSCLTFEGTTLSVTGVISEDSVDSKVSNAIDSFTNGTNTAQKANCASCAAKINTNAGSTTQPVYFEGGVPKTINYTVCSAVPTGAQIPTTIGGGLSFSEGVLSNSCAAQVEDNACRISCILGSSNCCLIAYKSTHATYAACWGSSSVCTCGNKDQPIYLYKGKPAYTCKLESDVPALACIPLGFSNDLEFNNSKILSIKANTFAGCSYVNGIVSGTTPVACATHAAGIGSNTYTLGCATQGIYICNGVICAASYSLGRDVPSDTCMITGFGTGLSFDNGTLSAVTSTDPTIPSDVCLIKSFGCGLAWDSANCSVCVDTSCFAAASFATCLTNVINGTDNACVACATNAANATTATCLGTTTVGSCSQPVYICNGTATALSYTIESNVPASACFIQSFGSCLNYDTTNKQLSITENAFAPYSCAAEISKFTATTNFTTVTCAANATAAATANYWLGASCSCGSLTQPIYLNNGIPALTCSLASNVPADVCFVKGYNLNQFTVSSDTCNVELCFGDVSCDNTDKPVTGCAVSNAISGMLGKTADGGAWIYYCGSEPTGAWTGNKPAIVFYKDSDGDPAIQIYE